jgi:hypothetical protein
MNNVENRRECISYSPASGEFLICMIHGNSQTEGQK